MGISLGGHQYGKAENRVLRVYRDTERHEIRDLTVSTALRGDFAAAYLHGDQSTVLPTDTQKNTVYAYAKTVGVESTEAYALALGRHFVDDVEPVTGARVAVEEHAWDRIDTADGPHAHSFVRRGQEVRTAVVTVEGASAWVVSGLRDLVVLKSTGSEFAGFLVDDYTTLQETHDRVMATSLVVRWRHAGLTEDWNGTYAAVRALLLATYAQVHSLALQQTLWEMGRAVLEAQPGIVEVRLSAPNIHHFAYDLARFGIESAGEVFHVDDRPYGLIEATVVRDDAPPAGPAWG